MEVIELPAYLDPASGSILLQLVVAGIIGGVGFFLKPLRRVLSWWDRSNKTHSQDETRPSPKRNNPDNSE